MNYRVGKKCHCLKENLLEFDIFDNSFFDFCRLKALGIDNLEVAMGSTPSCSQPGDLVKLLTEVHPGNYALNGKGNVTTRSLQNRHYIVYSPISPFFGQTFRLNFVAC